MAGKRKRPRSHNSGAADNFRKAQILSHAATLGTRAAAKEFGVDRKTVQRYKSEMDSGKNPELSQLVAREREITADRSRTKIQKALDVLLDRTIELAPTMTAEEAIHGVDKVGNLATARQVMNLDTNKVGDGKRVPNGSPVPGNEDLGGSAESDSSEFSTPVH
jgi:hypothetical protein